MNQLYADRLGRVCGQLENKGLTQMIVSDPLSIWYLTGVRIEPYERLFALYIRTDGKHVFFLNNLFVIPETDIGKVWMSDTDDCIGSPCGRRFGHGRRQKLAGPFPAGFDGT